MSLALVDPVTLAINLALIIGGVILAVVLLVTIIAAWTGINISVWRFRRRRADADARRRKFRPDGTPYPPAGRGLCDRCRHVSKTVYYLPSGERRCPACYAQESEESP